MLLCNHKVMMKMVMNKGDLHLTEYSKSKWDCAFLNLVKL